jgi:hypothetical protein
VAMIKRDSNSANEVVNIPAQVFPAAPNENKAFGMFKEPSVVVTAYKTIPNKGRDYDAEARGKTRCQLFGQAVAGLGYSAGMTFDWSKPDAIKNFAAKCIELADIGVKYSFQDTDEK